MTQEEKQLLLKDLCARLLYGVKIQILGLHSEDLYSIGKFKDRDELSVNDGYYIDMVRPYLRSLSSMTNEEREYLESLTNFHATPDVVRDKIDFYIERHLDFRGLISKGLALEAPADMYKTIEK